MHISIFSFIYNIFYDNFFAALKHFILIEKLKRAKSITNVLLIRITIRSVTNHGALSRPITTKPSNGNIAEVFIHRTVSMLFLVKYI